MAFVEVVLATQAFRRRDYLAFEILPRRGIRTAQRLQENAVTYADIGNYQLGSARALQDQPVYFQRRRKPLGVRVRNREFFGQLIRSCGGRNVFAELALLAAPVDREAVLIANPEVIIASGPDEQRPGWLDEWRSWPQLSAVKNGHLYFIPPDLIQRHTPRLLEGARRLCQQLDSARTSSSEVSARD